MLRYHPQRFKVHEIIDTKCCFKKSIKLCIMLSQSEVQRLNFCLHRGNVSGKRLTFESLSIRFSRAGSRCLSPFRSFLSLLGAPCSGKLLPRSRTLPLLSKPGLMLHFRQESPTTSHSNLRMNQAHPKFESGHS
ncbi:hypothetical protein GCM10009805_07020 [Leucobacter chromiireducens subsp. solipictus]